MVLVHSQGSLNKDRNGTWGVPHGSTSLFSSSLLPDLILNSDDSSHPSDFENNSTRSLLPDDDDLFAGLMDSFDFLDLEDEDDLFDSGGGMELDSLSIGVSAKIDFGGLVSGEHPSGEHPSRTLFVRNINSNIDDFELRSLFEQYGEIRSIYSACKQRGFVMISYYDIRAARSALRCLQNKPLRNRKLDIHFSIPKDNPSEEDLNQGTLVVFNLDQSVSKETLLQIFGSYGKVREIRETPQKRHHKFIEFYDIRAAEAALKALNGIEIAGKRIKLEPSRPGGTRRNYTHEDVEAQTSNSLIGSPVLNSPPPGNWPKYGSPNHLHGYSNNAGLASILPQRSSHAAGQIYSGSVAFQQSHSFPNQKLSTAHFPISSFVESTSSNLNLYGVETLSGPQSLWGSLTPFPHHTRSAWVTSRPDTAYANSRGSSIGVGSAPSIGPLTNNLGFYQESASFLGPVRYGSLAPANMNAHTVNTMVPETDLRNFRVMTNRPSLYGNGSYPGPGTITFESLRDHTWLQRGENSSTSQIDNNLQYQLYLDKIIDGKDDRTTLMIKNIPNKYTANMLLATIDESHEGTYDFLYLPIDFKNKCNVGYAFINMVSAAHIVSFYQTFNGRKWEKFNSEKVASLAYARIQGKSALVTRFQNSSLVNEDDQCQPILINSEINNLQAPLMSRNQNNYINLAGGSYSKDSLDMPKGILDKKL